MYMIYFTPYSTVLLYEYEYIVQYIHTYIQYIHTYSLVQ